MVQVDLAALRSIEREKEISFETLILALETALLSAYRHTAHSMPHARVSIDRRSGDVTVWAQEIDANGDIEEEYDDTPTDFGRVAAMTARQVILQRLRDAENDQTFGEYFGREGDIVTGIVQADALASQRGWSSSTSASSRLCCHSRSRCPVRTTATAPGSRPTSSVCRAACADRRSR